MAEKRDADLRRREVLKHLVTVGGVTPLATTGLLGASESPAMAQTKEAPPTPTTDLAPAPGYESLSPDEAAFVEALVSVMCPADHLTPNGVDCGLATFIDRQLAGGYGKGENFYMAGPWKKGKPQFGAQSPMTPEQFFKSGVAVADAACRSKFGKTLDALSPQDADGFLHEIAAGSVKDARVPMAAWFNELVYPLFVQACFADPIYGGNKDKIFWKMVGYPGLPATHTLDMVNYRGKPFPGAANPKSIADFS